ncbi:MAG: acyl-CoA dehydrogenase family protein [Myxococcota bacterium]|nr:acyl-CoA dehydrogenase family protein [Myxococcota bacterium]
MPPFSTASPLGSHDVTNQVPPLEEYNLYEQNIVLREAVEREGGGWASDRLAAYGGRMGSAEMYEAARMANTWAPVLHTHDRYGHRIDEVEFHPSYHKLMRVAVEHGNHAMAWMEKRAGSHVARAALCIMHSEVEPATQCPLTMTHSVIPSLRNQPEIAAEWEPRILTNTYDGSMRPANQKAGATMGMAMTEKQGGSDVRANSTRAVPMSGAVGPGAEYLLTGHKWFCSAPMSDAFLTLAYTDSGLSCFFVPRFTPDGAKNNFFLQRLKRKIGNRANASSELEYRNTWAKMVGEDGRGVPTIIEMVHHTRLDVALGATGLMRQAISQALHHAQYRFTFGKRLIEHSLMKNVLADLSLEVEAATALSLRMARAFDAGDQPAERLLARLGTAVSKYWISKRATNHVTECLECHGGNGYIDDQIMGRLFREAPLGSIWEGSGNVQCLDVLRALKKTPHVAEALVQELDGAQGVNRTYDVFVERLKDSLRLTADLQIRARRFVADIALALSGAQLVQHAPSEVSDAFCASRLGGDWGQEYGTLSSAVAFDRIIDRARPRIGQD